MTFTNWFNENKDSDQLQENYIEHCKEVFESSGGKAPSFREYAKEVYLSGEHAGDD